MANSRQYTDEELIQRVWDVEEIKKLIHKRVIYIANEMRKEEFNDLWVQNPEHKKTASFGRNTGYYTGMDAIHDYYVVHHQKEREKQLKELHAANPAIADIPQNLHIGCLSNHPVSTGLVELAGDGKTAKGLWYSIAQETEAQPDGTGKALWMPEKIAVDFVKEKDGWKIWHIVVSTDLVSEAGEDYSEQEVYHNYETNPVDVEFGTPTIAKLIHNTDFNWWDNYPPMPEAYETFSDAVSYGPEGYVRPALYGLNSKEGRNFR